MSTAKENLNQSIKLLEKRVDELESQLKEKDIALMEAKDLLAAFQKQIKECEELKSRIDKEIEARLDRLMFKQFDGCRRCKGQTSGVK
jgi:predicted ATP-binding protein involved in virulence